MSASVRLRDEELLRLIAQRDAEALGLLYDRYAGLVFSLVLHMSGDHGCAEHVTEDVFHRIWTDPHMCGSRLGTVSPACWIMDLARRRAIDTIRLMHDGERHREMWHANRSLVGDGVAANRGEHASVRGDVRAALALLSNEQRQAIDLAYYGGLTTTQIASMEAIPIGTVKSRLRSGLTALREALQHDTARATHIVRVGAADVSAQ